MFNREMVKRKSPFGKKIGLTIFLVQDKVEVRKFFLANSLKMSCLIEKW